MNEHDFIARLMGHFEYKHLPEELQEISKPFGTLARKIKTKIYRNEMNVIDALIALDHLLKAKDAAVRGAL